MHTAGNFALGAGIVIDFTLSITGNQSWAKTTLNTAVGAGAVLIGGIPGTVIGVGYLVIDKTGMLKGPTGPFPPINPLNACMPDATIIAPLRRTP